MATTLEVVQGISQALADKYHGAVDPKTGEAVKIGLRREKEIPITEKGVIDGFSVSFYGDKLCIKYCSEIFIKEAHNPQFESEIEQIYANIAKHIQKKYKGHTGRALGLKPLDEVEIKMQSISRKRNWIECRKHYKIRGLKGNEDPYTGKEDAVRDAVKKFLSMGKNNVPY